MSFTNYFEVNIVISEPASVLKRYKILEPSVFIKLTEKTNITKLFHYLKNVKYTSYSPMVLNVKLAILF